MFKVVGKGSTIILPELKYGLVKVRVVVCLVISIVDCVHFVGLEINPVCIFRCIAHLMVAFIYELTFTERLDVGLFSGKWSYCSLEVNCMFIKPSECFLNCIPFLERVAV